MLYSLVVVSVLDEECRFCKRMSDMWERLKSQLSSRFKNINIYSVKRGGNEQQNAHLFEKFENIILGFPTVFLFERNTWLSLATTPEAKVSAKDKNLFRVMNFTVEPGNEQDENKENRIDRLIQAPPDQRFNPFDLTSLFQWITLAIKSMEAETREKIHFQNNSLVTSSNYSNRTKEESGKLEGSPKPQRRSNGSSLPLSILQPPSSQQSSSLISNRNNNILSPSQQAQRTSLYSSRSPNKEPSRFTLMFEKENDENLSSINIVPKDGNNPLNRYS